MRPARNSDHADNNLFTLNINWDGFRGELEKLIERSFAAKTRELREQIKQELLTELRGSGSPDDEEQSIISEDDGLSSLSNGERVGLIDQQQVVEVLKIDGRANNTTYFVRWSNGEKSWISSRDVQVPHHLRRRYWNKCRIERERLARQSM